MIAYGPIASSNQGNYLPPPIEFFRMNSSPNASTGSVGALTITNVGTPAVAVAASLLGNGFSFEVGGLATTGNALDTASFTIAGFLNRSQVDNSPRLVIKNGPEGIRFCVDASTLYIQFTAGDISVAKTLPVIPGSWYFMAGGYNAATEKAFIYAAPANDPTIGDVVETDLSLSPDTGAYEFDADNQAVALDAWSIWSSVLSAAQLNLFFSGKEYYSGAWHSVSKSVQPVAPNAPALDPQGDGVHITGMVDDATTVDIEISDTGAFTGEQTTFATNVGTDYNELDTTSPSESTRWYRAVANRDGWKSFGASASTTVLGAPTANQPTHTDNLDQTFTPFYGVLGTGATAHSSLEYQVNSGGYNPCTDSVPVAASSGDAIDIRAFDLNIYGIGPSSPLDSFVLT